jgi:hypothetical protein
MRNKIFTVCAFIGGYTSMVFSYLNRTALKWKENPVQCGFKQKDTNKMQL